MIPQIGIMIGAYIITRMASFVAMKSYIFLIIVLLLVPSSVNAYPRFGVGYSANLPKEYFGFNLLAINSEPMKFGIFVDAKMNLDPRQRDNYYSNISKYEASVIWGDRNTGKCDSWLSINCSLIFTLTSNLAIYSGVGHTSYRTYLEYRDPFRILGDNGKYLVFDAEEGSVNVLGGVIIVIKNSNNSTDSLPFTWFVQFGLESNPQGITFGLGFITY